MQDNPEYWLGNRLRDDKNANAETESYNRPNDEIDPAVTPFSCRASRQSFSFPWKTRKGR